VHRPVQEAAVIVVLHNVIVTAHVPATRRRGRCIDFAALVRGSGGGRSSAGFRRHGFLLLATRRHGTLVT
jgi:hypothetical protein